MTVFNSNSPPPHCKVRSRIREAPVMRSPVAISADFPSFSGVGSYPSLRQIFSVIVVTKAAELNTAHLKSTFFKVADGLPLERSVIGKPCAPRNGPIILCFNDGTYNALWPLTVASPLTTAFIFSVGRVFPKKKGLCWRVSQGWLRSHFREVDQE